MPRIRRATRSMLATTSLLLATSARLHSQSASTATLDDPDIKLLFPLAQQVQVMAELCLKELPAQSMGVPAALAAWNVRHARPQLDSVIERTFRRRAALGRSIIRSMGASLFHGDPAGACSNFAAFIATPEFDLSIGNPAALSSARRKLGAPDVAAPVITASAVPTTTSQTPVATLTGSATPATVHPTPAVSTAEVAPPRRWSRKVMTDGSTAFSVSRPDSGSATIVIARPLPLAGLSVENALRGWLRSQLANRLELSLKNTVYSGRTVHGRPAAWADESADFHNSRNGLRILGVEVAHRDNTFTPVLMFTRDDADQYHYVDEFGAWFNSITLPGDIGPRWSPLAPTTPGSLQGLWFGTQLRTQLNIYGGIDMIAHRDYIAMYHNGFAYRALPDGGRIDNPNAAALCVQDPGDCGTYRVEPTRIVFEWNTKLGLVESDTATIDMPRKDPPGFEHNGISMYRVQPAPLTRLDGEFTSIDGSSSGPNGSIALSRSITFHADGRYEATRSVGFVSTPGASTGSEQGSVVGYNPNIGPNRGTYEINGYTLTMRPADGPARIATIIFFDDERPVTSVLIDDNYYKK